MERLLRIFLALFLASALALWFIANSSLGAALTNWLVGLVIWITPWAAIVCASVRSGVRVAIAAARNTTRPICRSVRLALYGSTHTTGPVRPR